VFSSRIAHGARDVGGSGRESLVGASKRANQRRAKSHFPKRRKIDRNDILIKKNTARKAESFSPRGDRIKGITEVRGQALPSPWLHL